MRRLSEIALEEPCYQWYKRGAVRKPVGRAPRCDPTLLSSVFILSGSPWGARLVVTWFSHVRSLAMSGSPWGARLVVTLSLIHI